MSQENQEKELNIRIWEKIIDVQQHFNDVKSKNQTLFISVITTLLAGAGILYKTGSGHERIFFIYLYSLPLLAAFVFTIAFYILDYGIYHNLLKGSVECGKRFEKEYLNLKLTSIIIEECSEDAKVFGIKGAGSKLKWFYRIIGVSLLMAFCALNFKLWLKNSCILNHF